jgi:hypothetical protein
MLRKIPNINISILENLSNFIIAMNVKIIARFCFFLFIFMNEITVLTSLLFSLYYELLTKEKIRDGTAIMES